MSSNKIITAAIIAAGFLIGAGTAGANPGDLDPSFGVGGRVVIDVPNYVEAAASIVEARDGKLLVGHVLYWPAHREFSVIRFNPDGTRDATFGKSGRASVSLEAAESAVHAVIEQADGKIVAAGAS